MQEMASNWPVIGLILAGEFIFGVGYAILTRHVARHGPQGQTVWLVVGGVAGVVAIASPVLGLELVGFLAACFSAAGLSMIVEYLGRMAYEEQEANKVTENSLDVHASADR